jgi:Transglutaminase-like superfamily
MASRHGITRSRVARFRSLAPPDRGLFLVALLAIAFVRVGLWLTSFRRLHRAFERIAPPAGAPDPTPGEAERIGWAVGSAARFVPDATCLPQALAAEAILRHRGHPADLRIGVTRDGGGVQAHAWVESYGRVIVGDGDLERFAPLLRHALGEDVSRAP